MKLQLFALLISVATVPRIDAQGSLNPGTYIIHSVAWPSQVLAPLPTGSEVVGRDEKSALPLDKTWIAAWEKDESGSQFITFQNARSHEYFGMDQNYHFLLSRSKFFWIVNRDGDFYRIHDKPSLKSTWIQLTGSSDEAKLQLALRANDDRQRWNFEPTQL